MPRFSYVRTSLTTYHQPLAVCGLALPPPTPTPPLGILTSICALITWNIWYPPCYLGPQYPTLLLEYFKFSTEFTLPSIFSFCTYFLKATARKCALVVEMSTSDQNTQPCYAATQPCSLASSSVCMHRYPLLLPSYSVLKENLSKKGVLNGIKSQIQAAVFKELDDKVLVESPYAQTLHMLRCTSVQFFRRCCTDTCK